MTWTVNQRHDARFRETWKTNSFGHTVMQMNGEEREKSLNVYHDLMISWKPSLPFASTSSRYVQRVRKCGSTHSALQKATLKMSPGSTMAVYWVFFFPVSYWVYGVWRNSWSNHRLFIGKLSIERNWKSLKGESLVLETILSILYLKYQDIWSPRTSRDRIKGTETLHCFFLKNCQDNFPFIHRTFLRAVKAG